MSDSTYPANTAPGVYPDPNEEPVRLQWRYTDPNRPTDEIPEFSVRRNGTQYQWRLQVAPTVDQSSGSLTAAGGWCAPTSGTYDPASLRGGAIYESPVYEEGSRTVRTDPGDREGTVMPDGPPLEDNAPRASREARLTADLLHTIANYLQEIQ